MTSRLGLRLLGGFALLDAQGRTLRLPTRKAEALLAYLALEAPVAPARQSLAGLLWGGRSEAAALASLRQALSLIGKCCARPVITSSGRNVALAVQHFDIDTDRLDAADGSADALRLAVSHYRGELLAGHDLGEAAFDDWLQGQRRRLHERALHLCQAWFAACGDDGEAALQAGRRWLELDPLDEAAHRALMLLHARHGRRASALRQYQVCVQVLRRELGSEPDTATRRLYHELLLQPAVHDAGTIVGAMAKGATPQTVTTAPVHEAALVGRDAEMTRLMEALDDARLGSGRVLALFGDAGLGKTRLAQELAARAADVGVTVHVGRCHESQQLVPFAPWVDMLRTARLATDDVLLARLGPVWRAELTGLLPELGAAADRDDGESAAPARQARLFEALAQVFAALVARGPTLLLLEDLHWCDEISLRLLAMLARRLRDWPMLLLLTAREEELPSAPALQRTLRELAQTPAAQELPSLALKPLSREQTAALVASLRRAGDVGQDALAEQVWLASEGNPFVVVEAVRAVDGARPDEHTGTLPLSRRVRDLILGHVERVGADARRLLWLVAVAGRETDYGLLVRAAGMDHLRAADALEELVRRRLLCLVGEAFDVQHARVRHAIVEGLLPPLHSALHLAWAEALEPSGEGEPSPAIEQLAYHYKHTDHHAKAVHYLTRLAQRAAHDGAHVQALALLGEARAHAARLPPAHGEPLRRDLTLRQARSLFFLGRFAEVLALLLPEQAAIDAAGEPLLAATYYLRRGSTRTYLGEHAQAIDDARRALHEATACDDVATMGKAHFLLSLEHFWAHPEQGVAHGEHAVALLSATPERWWTGQACWILGLNLSYRGRFAEGLAMEARAAALAESTGDRRLASYAAWTRGFIQALAGELDGALQACRRSVELALDPLNRMTSLGILALVLIERREVRQALEVLAEAIPQALQFRIPQMHGLFLGFRGEAELLRGKLQAARDAAMEGATITRDAGYAYGHGWTQRVLARIARADGSTAEADRQMAAAIVTFDVMGAPFEAARSRIERAEGLAQSGRRDEALALARAALAVVEGLGLAAQAALARRLCQRLGGLD